MDTDRELSVKIRVSNPYKSVMQKRSNQMLKTTTKKTNFLLVTCTGLFLAFVFARVPADTEAQGAAVKEQKILKKESKNIQGEVTWISKNKIAIVFSHGQDTEEEILLPFDKNVALEHVSDLAQIKQGDTVYVEYEETTQETKEGTTQVTDKAKTISFIRAGTPKLPPQQPSEGTITEAGDESTGTFTSQ
jgi:hypothetical protein